MTGWLRARPRSQLSSGAMSQKRLRGFVALGDNATWPSDHIIACSCVIPTTKFTAILLVMMSRGRFSGQVRRRRLRRLEILHLAHGPPRGAPFLLVAVHKLRHWIMTLFAGPSALYPRGR
jgi:hypothetical protein